MNYIIFGGSGFIGTHLIHLLKSECVKSGDKIYDLDIVMPGEEGVVPGIVEKNDGVEYIRLDVRKPIEFDFEPTKDDVIFNLAAVHRTPGRPDHAYFETNIYGAENVTAFAEKHGIRKILFTSSIAPYGAAEELKTEDTLPTPNTPYGISKLVAEKIHQIWQAKDSSRELTIVRPGIVYGKGEHGNMTRLYGTVTNKMSKNDEHGIVTSRHWNHPSMFLSTELYKQNGFDETFPAYADFNLYLKMRKQGVKIRVINRVITNFVADGVSTNTNMKKVLGRAKEKYKAYRGNGYSALYWFESYGWEVFKAIYFSIRS